MKITRLRLYDHNRLRVSRIKELEIDINHTTQLIIGSNGSGKSSVIHELFPIPPIKSSFGRHGYKSLSIEHDGEVYELVFDVSDGHQFYRGSENLNKNGSYDIQKNLIYEHFGITSEIHTLLKCNLQICDMIPSSRKKILMSLNPIDVTIFLETYQKVHKNVLSYKNNLDRLYQRQKQLMTELLPTEQYQMLIEKKELLENQEKLLLIWMTHVTSDLEKFPHTEHNTTDIQKYIDIFRKLFGERVKYKNTTISKCRALIIEKEAEISYLTSDSHRIGNDVEKTVQVINEYEVKKKEVSQNDNALDEELSNVENRYKTFQFSDGFIPIQQDQIHQSRCIYDDIHVLIVELSYILFDTINTQNEIQQMYTRLIDCRSTRTNLQRKITDTTAKIEEYQKSIVIYDVSENCDKTSCTLHSEYMKSITSKQKILDDLKLTLQTVKLELEKVENEVTVLEESYSIQLAVWKIVNQIYQKLQTSALRTLMSDDKVLELLRTHPKQLTDTINTYIDQSERYYEYVVLQKRLEELRTLKSSRTSKAQISIEIINNELTNHTARLTEYRQRYESCMSRITLLQNEVFEYQQYERLYHSFVQLHGEIDVLTTNAENYAQYTFLSKLYRIMKRHLDDVRSELIRITSICKEQELLDVRLDKEVNTVIEELRPKYEQAKLVENALQELPIKYTKTFVNSILEITNYFINEIATYPINLVLMTDDQECTFEFPVNIDGVLVKDINQCSAGQKTIIQLAFNLAMIVELKFNNYGIYCDELDRTLDTAHSRRLVEMLNTLVDRGIASQLFIVGHFKSFLDAFAGSGDTLVLNSENVILPSTYNTNTRITYY